MKGIDRLLEFDAFVLGELEVEAALDASATDNSGPAE